MAHSVPIAFQRVRSRFPASAFSAIPPYGRRSDDCGRLQCYTLNMETSAQRHVFVIRIWQEDDRARERWRASVLHVGSGQRLATTELRDVEDFVRMRLRAVGLLDDASRTQST
jgi:hypothetical protein